MSMFDRNIKLQFNEMKYAKQHDNKYLISRITTPRREAMFARIIFFTLGFCATASLLNTDVQKYKGLKGVIRWKHRVENVLYFNIDVLRTSSWT
jgi:hypothetical protein